MIPRNNGKHSTIEQRKGRKHVNSTGKICKEFNVIDDDKSVLLFKSLCIVVHFPTNAASASSSSLRRVGNIGGDILS